MARITLNRPEAMNALDGETLQLLGAHLQAFETDDALRVAILTGAGEKAFCACADLKKKGGGGVAELWNRERQHFRAGGQALNVTKPLIAAINGYCLAGGLELALGCDIRIGSTRASFGAPEVRWSLLHGYGALRLPQTVPMSVAMDMLLTGERVDAKRAYEVGLISRLVAPEELLASAQAMAERISENGPLAVRLTKDIALRALYLPTEDVVAYRNSVSALLALSEDAKEGPRAFSEKRKPEFKGR
ncbi:MAG: enoyl-CoA hydratase/isomerase family protein [Burkholderiales bacterium]